MIAEINAPVEDISHALEYLFNKNEKGQGEIIGGNIPSVNSNKDNLREYLASFIERNSRIRNVDKNIRSISISLAPGEGSTNEQFSNIANEYLGRMGYVDCPYVVFRHHDTDKEHIHIVVSQVDVEGKRINDGNEFYRSMTVSREMEIDLNLQQTEYFWNKSLSLKEVNFEKYSCSRAMTKLSADMYLQLDNALGNSLNTIKDKSNNDMKQILGNNMQVLIDFLQSQDLFTKLIKQELVEKLDSIRSKSRNGKDFLQQIENDKSIYMRKVYDKKGVPDIVYGLTDKAIYLRGGQYPPRFSLTSLSTYDKENQKPIYSEKEQKKFLSFNAKKALRDSTSLHQFENNCDERGVGVHYNKNKSGEIKGIKFYSKNVENPYFISGSVLNRENLGFNKIQITIESNKNKEAKKSSVILEEVPISEDETTSSKNYVHKVQDQFFDERDNDVPKRKKKKKKNDLNK